jgi:hypothetical protein
MDNESQSPKGVDDILTEQELLDLLGIKKSKLDDLRYRHQLPFCKVSNTARIYLVKDVLDFIASKRTVCVPSVDVRNSIFLLSKLEAVAIRQNRCWSIFTDFNTLASRKWLRSIQSTINRWIQAELLCNCRASNLGDFCGQAYDVLEEL